MVKPECAPCKLQPHFRTWQELLMNRARIETMNLASAEDGS
jgi:hypothetical protein